ncbi:DUF2232 domain-containing protein [uncultured Alsobacter sp.]|uniref:DUF2232 domain-containing protein n=1 Tax=uncultured Alsobacter sp. TaxID=1748258 RepID=UPI0025F2957F|nr:DUF2232 domain-containing protein [uncultured Alsobacter sp.]
MGSILGIGAGAGFVSALLFAVITTANPLAILLYLVAPLPILLAALGWNHRAGLAAAATGSGILALAFAPAVGLVFAASVALPAWWFAYLCLLARNNPDGSVEWYPLGRLLVWIVSLSAALTLVGAIMIGGDYANFVKAFERAVLLIEQINPNTFEGVSGDARTRQVEDLARLFATIAPPISAALSVGTSVLLAWTAARIVKASGRLPRPWPAIPDTALPGWALAAFGGAAAGALVLSGYPGLFFRSVAAALLMAYCLQGLAVIHVVTRNLAGRGGILTAAYLVFFIMPGWPAVLFALVGMSDAIFGWRARRGAAPPANPTP